MDSDDSDIIVEYIAKPPPITPLSKNDSVKDPVRNNAAKRSPKPSPKSRKIPATGSPQKTILDFFRSSRKQPGKISVRKDLMENSANTTEKKAPQFVNLSQSPPLKRTMKRFKSTENLVSEEIENDVPVVINRTPTKTPPVAATLSPGVRKRMNRFKSVTPEKSPARKKLIITDIDSDSVEVVLKVTNLDPLTLMINEVARNQKLVKRSTTQAIELLFSQEEDKIMQVYLSLSQPAQAVFMKRFFGKENWHRVEEDADAVKELSDKDLILTNVGDISLISLLNLLKMGELTRIFKKYVGNSNAKRKEAMIESLLRNARTQKSLFATSVSRELLIRQEALAELGPIYKVSAKSRVAMSRVVLLFSVVHTIDDEARRAQITRHFISQILKGEIKFATYEVIPVPLFETRSDFIEYESALKIRISLNEGFEKKKFKHLENIAGNAKEMLERLLGDAAFIARFEKLPHFLKRFSAGSVLASVLTHYCERFKKQHNPDTVIAILTMLLEQKYFALRRRGNWYELLCQAYLSASKTEMAVNILTIAKIDPSLDEVKILTLQIKVQRLQKQKKFADSLGLWSTDVWAEPASIEINGQALSNVPGSKLVYVQKTGDGVRYSSVEEHAIAFYKSHGYPQGAHTEGFIISTIFYTLFFDVIYSKVPGAFLSQFQDRPLDFYSSSFFTNREAAFTKRLNEMQTWTANTAALVIENCFKNNLNTYCVISWSETVTWKTLADIVECLGISAVTTICKRFIYQPHLARSGFPDLTLWNLTTKKCKFVEVKSPKDTLMPNQRVWLSYLKDSGIDCEVCNVRNVASKSAATSDSYSPVE